MSVIADVLCIAKWVAELALRKCLGVDLSLILYTLVLQD